MPKWIRVLFLKLDSLIPVVCCCCLVLRMHLREAGGKACSSGPRAGMRQNADKYEEELWQYEKSGI